MWVPSSAYADFLEAMAAKRPALASLRYAKAPLSPRYQRELHRPLGHFFLSP